MTRSIWNFHGGIHPPENKLQSLSRGIESAGIPDQLILPLSQHLGAPAEPCVAVGDQVLKGQVIAEAAGYVSVPVHAPSSGTVTGIGEQQLPHSSGLTGPCITITTDGQDQWVQHEGLPDFKQADAQTILDKIRNAGVCGMGGAGFPAAVKLNPPKDKVISTLIINGTECEPYITADDVLMRERADEIVTGLLILAQLLEPLEILIGIEDNKPEAIAAMQESMTDAIRAALENTEIEIVTFPTKYPSGGEKQLIQILTGKEVPSGGLPADIGIVCQNLGTVAAVYRAVVHGEPLISRITTVTGEAVSNPGNFDVLLGTPMSHLLELSGYDKTRNKRLIMGGPMMGFTLPSANVPVVKTTNCLLAPTEQEAPTQPPAQACIRCGMCAQACPATLLPQQLFWYSQSKDYEKLEDYNLFDCIECGACSYVCPSNIPLVQYYRSSKTEIRHLKQERIRAEQSRERFENREARLEKLEAEKEARRRARKEAAKNRNSGKDASQEMGAEKATGDQADLVKAAVARVKAKKTANKESRDLIDEASGNTEPDTAQLAIQKALAARASNTEDKSPKEKLENTIAATEKRRANARKKLDAAIQEGADTVEILQDALGKLETRLADAQRKLAELEENST